MRVYGYKEFTWKNNECYLGEEYVGELYPLYWIRWPDGTVSKDKYNLDRAKDNLIKEAMARKNRVGDPLKTGQETPLEAPLVSLNV